MKFKILAAAVAAAAAFYCAPALAEDLVFMLDNQSSESVVEFYASPVGVDDWEEDILAGAGLESGGASRITIADGRSVCEYDLLLVFESGEQMEERQIDLCATGSYTVSD